MECSAWPKNLSSSRKHAIQNLLHAQNPTKKFTDIFDAHSQTGNITGPPLFAEHLVVSVLGSFSNTLSLSSNTESDEVLQVPTNACVTSEVSGGSESINTPLPRKTLDTRTRLDQNLINEGQQWRTYHQESIINFELPGETSDLWWTARASHDLDDGYQWRMIVDQGMIPEFPGSYFTCAHRIDQGCQATKLVERTLRDPRLFLITYRGRHTCEIILESPHDDDNPIFFDFLSVNQEQKLPSEDDLNPHGHSHGDDSSKNNNQSASSDYGCDLDTLSYSHGDNRSDNDQSASADYCFVLESAGEIRRDQWDAIWPDSCDMDDRAQWDAIWADSCDLYDILWNF